MSQRCAYAGITSFYAQWVPMIHAIGRKHGYCVVVHGSMATDLDVLAVPWTNEAADADTLANAIFKLMCGPIPGVADDDDWRALTFSVITQKPHGRRAQSIYLDAACKGPYIDLSIMPRKESL
ncbi:MAG: hypothetical protein JWQ03_3218 [Variovorax sp.]|nr:hypothetical protein [Variovorax sp.]